MTHTTMTGPGGYAVAFDGSSTCHVADCVIRGFNNGLSATIGDCEIVARGNLIEDCPGIALHAHSPSSGFADLARVPLCSKLT
jgi:hypothetical protein